jgi:uncharacterized surface anchored protein
VRTRTAPRPVRIAAVTIVIGTAGSLIWAPAALAASAETPPAVVPSEAVPDPDFGGIRIEKKDPDGAAMASAEFELRDDTGTTVNTGTTDADGELAYTALAPGIYRLTETSSGSPLHDVVPAQDVIVPPDAVASVTIIDPFLPADLTVTKTDKTSGEALAGAVINITPNTGDGPAITVTTGTDGTAHTQLPVLTRTGIDYTVIETEAPAGYQLDATPVTITAEPATPISVTITNTTVSAPPTKAPEPEDTDTPAGNPPPDPNTPETDDEPRPVKPHGTSSTLADTGASAATWATGIAGVLMVAGASALWATRHRNTHPRE